MRKLSLVLLAALAACGPKIVLQQPIVVGSPGKVYQSTEAEVSVDVVNNSRLVGNIVAGDVVIYEGLQPGEIKNVGFDCGGAVIVEKVLKHRRRTAARTEYLYFVPDNSNYRTVSHTVSVSCGRQRKTQFRINTVQRVR